MIPKIKKFIALVCTSAMTITILSACGNNEHESSESRSSSVKSETSRIESETSSVESESVVLNNIDAVFGEIRTEYNQNLDLTDYPLTASDVPEDFMLIVEAESGTLTGSAAAHDLAEASGGKFVNGEIGRAHV